MVISLQICCRHFLASRKIRRYVSWQRGKIKSTGNNDGKKHRENIHRKAPLNLLELLFFPLFFFKHRKVPLNLSELYLFLLSFFQEVPQKEMNQMFQEVSMKKNWIGFFLGMTQEGAFEPLGTLFFSSRNFFFSGDIPKEMNKLFQEVSGN